LVEIFHDTVGGTDSRFHLYSDYLGSIRQIVNDDSNPGSDSRFDYTAYGLNDTEKDYSGLPFNAKCPYKLAGTWGYYDGSGRGSTQSADGMTLCGHLSTPTSR
jgi:hypothetical protein